MDFNNEYDIQAARFMQNTNTRIEITYKGIVYGFPFDSHDTSKHADYYIRLRKDGKSYGFHFYQSAYATSRNQRPRHYDILACLDPYMPEDFGEFIQEYGYLIDSAEEYHRVEKIFKARAKHVRRLHELYTEEELEQLAEIC